MVDYVFVKDQQRIREGEEEMGRLLMEVDQEMVARLLEDQVEVVGGDRGLYRLLDSSLKATTFQPSLLVAQSKLYNWRRDFFVTHFPVNRGLWFTDSYCRDTVTFQVTVNWDQVLALGCSRSRPRGVFFTSDGMKTREARRRLDDASLLLIFKEEAGGLYWTRLYLTENYMLGSSLCFQDVAQIILEQHRLGPDTLKQQALRQVVKSSLPLSSLPLSLQEASREGLLHPSLTPSLTCLGTERWHRLLSLHQFR